MKYYMQLFLLVRDLYSTCMTAFDCIMLLTVFSLRGKEVSLSLFGMEMLSLAGLNLESKGF